MKDKLDCLTIRASDWIVARMNETDMGLLGMALILGVGFGLIFVDAAWTGVL